MMISDPEIKAELIQFATQVNEEGQVGLGHFDEGELLALGLYSVGRGRAGHAPWPPYLGLSGGVESVLAAAVDHPEIQAAGRRLAERGLAIAAPRDDQAPTGWKPIGSARVLKLLSDAGNGAVGWFSGSMLKTTRKLSPSGVNGTIGFSWLGADLDGLCLIQTTSVPDAPTPEGPLITNVSVARPEIAAQYVVQAAYREPLTAQEQDSTSGTRCLVILSYPKGKSRASLPLEFWHEWGAAVVFNRKQGSGEPRRGLLASRKGMLDADALTAVITKMTTDFVHYPS